MANVPMCGRHFNVWPTFQCLADISMFDRLVLYQRDNEGNILFLTWLFFLSSVNPL